MLSELWYRGVNRWYDSQAPGVYRPGFTDRAARFTDSKYSLEHMGTKPEVIIGDVCDILGSTYAIYLDPERTFNGVLAMYVAARNDTQRTPVKNLARRLAQHDLDAWRYRGPFVQELIVARIAAISDDTMVQFGSIIPLMLGEILSTTATARTRQADTITIERGAVPPTEELAAMRRDAINQLRRLYWLVTASDADEVLTALDAAALTPHGSGHTSELGVIIMRDLTEVVRFYIDIEKRLDLERRRELEVRLFNHYYRYSCLPDGMSDDAKLVSAHLALVAEIQACRAAFDSNSDYMYYKTLVGYDSVLPIQWENASYDYAEQVEERTASVEALARVVDAVNGDAWLERIERYVQTKSEDYATFTQMVEFLRKVAIYRPEVVVGWLPHLSDRLSQWLGAMLSGLVESGHGETVTEFLLLRIEEGRYLSSIAWYLRAAELFEGAVLVRVVERAMAVGDACALVNSLMAAVSQFEKNPDRLVDEAFLPAARSLVKVNNFRWVGGGFFTWRNQSILAALSEPQAREVLEGVLRPDDLTAHFQPGDLHRVLEFPLPG